ncbi:MAG: T9SS type A sorting domain-containing protein [Saprospiraceae bacterium]|jgi:hypothetical protein|nr:T9SS type A sorting domain-containing protein [Saprospiraceae bacterium]
MKHTATLFAFFLFLAQTSTAQVTWFNAADQWTFHITSGWVGQGIETIMPEKDTVVDGVAYKKLLRNAQFANGTYSSDFRLMRQEGQKVFARSQWPVVSYDELMLYDFALNVGDTVHLPLYENQNPDLAYVISEVTTVDIGSQTRVKQVIRWLNSPVEKGTLIEGIGCVEGLHKIGGEDCLTEAYLFLDEPTAAAVDGPERKFCSFQSGSFSFEGLGVVLCKALPVQTPAELPVNVYPSLSSGTLFFSMPDPTTSFLVTLFDPAGKQVLQTTLIGDGSITTAYKGTAVVWLQTASGTAVRRVVLY